MSSGLLLATSTTFFWKSGRPLSMSTNAATVPPPEIVGAMPAGEATCAPADTAPLAEPAAGPGPAMSPAFGPDAPAMPADTPPTPITPDDAEPPPDVDPADAPRPSAVMNSRASAASALVW